MRTLNDIVRGSLRWCMDATVSAGAAWVGVSVGPEREHDAARPAHVQRAAQHRDRWVEAEAARGIVELERFLDRQRHT